MAKIFPWFKRALVAGLLAVAWLVSPWALFGGAVVIAAIALNPLAMRIPRSLRPRVHGLLKSAVDERKREGNDLTDFVLDGQRFLCGTLDGVEFHVSREVRVPSWRGRKYWCRVKDWDDLWAEFGPKDPAAKLIDDLFEGHEPRIVLTEEDDLEAEPIEEAAPQAAEPPKEDAPCESGSSPAPSP